jgi:hypothetical protein
MTPFQDDADGNLCRLFLEYARVMNTERAVMNYYHVEP